MIDFFFTAAYGVTALASVYSVYLMLRNRPVDNPLFFITVALEIVLLVIVVAGIVALVNSDQAGGEAVFISYLATMIILLPVAFLWGIAEKSRWGTGAFLVVLISTYVLVYRVVELWPTQL